MLPMLLVGVRLTHNPSFLLKPDKRLRALDLVLPLLLPAPCLAALAAFLRGDLARPLVNTPLSLRFCVNILQLFGLFFARSLVETLRSVPSSFDSTMEPSPVEDCFSKLHLLFLDLTTLTSLVAGAGAGAGAGASASTGPGVGASTSAGAGAGAGASSGATASGCLSGSLLVITVSNGFLMFVSSVSKKIFTTSTAAQTNKKCESLFVCMPCSSSGNSMAPP